jgi:hypothetical protein
MLWYTKEHPYIYCIYIMVHDESLTEFGERFDVNPLLLVVGHRA